MPELPDVQVYKEYVDATALHQPIADLQVSNHADVLAEVAESTLRGRLKGRSLEASRRHGKHLFLGLEDDGWLRLHFGMTGGLKYYARESEAPQHARLRIDFDNGYHLAYRSVRKLGEVAWVEDVDEFVAAHGLGPDPLDPALDFSRFRDALTDRRGTIKGALMNQEVLAGIGNVYSDEMLLSAGIHPAAKVGGLNEQALERLYRAMLAVLRQAIEARVDPDRFPPSFILPNRQEGAACPRCGGRLRRARVSGRVAYYCPHDQPRE
jgi:formamidopyrimidine-DNA glycosylase